MTEIPEHLLKRSQARKQELSGDAAASPAPSGAAAPAVAPAPVGNCSPGHSAGPVPA